MLVLVAVVGCGMFWPQPSGRSTTAPEPGAESGPAPLTLNSRSAGDSRSARGPRSTGGATAVLSTAPRTQSNWPSLLEDIDQLAKEGSSETMDARTHRLREAVTRGVRAVGRSACQPIGRRRLRLLTQRALSYLGQEVPTTPFWVELLLDQDLLRTDDESLVQRLASRPTANHALEIWRLLVRTWHRQVRDGRVPRPQRRAAAQWMQIRGTPSEQKAAENWLSCR